MKKVIILLAKNGDIAMVANHYIKHHIQEEKPVWVVSAQYSPILTELYNQYFDIHPLEIDATKPLLAEIIARRKWPNAHIKVVQQHGADEQMEETRLYRNFQAYQLSKLDELFR
jgi:hypothetical protein